MSGVTEQVFRPVSTKLDVPAVEREVIERWAQRDTMARYLARNEGSERKFSFIDGPITANNPMGVHHAWGRTLKDVFQRYKALRGHHQRYQNGFDCQGLWIEVGVEKELGLNSKREIEEFGLEEFARRCRAVVERSVRGVEELRQPAVDLVGPDAAQLATHERVVGGELCPGRFSWRLDQHDPVLL